MAPENDALYCMDVRDKVPLVLIAAEDGLISEHSKDGEIETVQLYDLLLNPSIRVVETV